MATKQKILIVDDDNNIAELVAEAVPYFSPGSDPSGSDAPGY